MTQEQKAGTETTPQPKSRIEVLEEVVTTMVDKLEQIAKSVAALEKTTIKKSTQRFGAEHKAKAVKDTKTGKIYPSLFNAGKQLASEFGLDPLNNQVWYQIQKKEPERFQILAADDPEAVAAQEAAKAEVERQVAEANKRAEEEEKAKAEAEAEAEAKAKTGKGKK